MHPGARWLLPALFVLATTAACAGDVHRRAPPDAAVSRTRIHGTLRTHDGAAPILAHARVHDPAGGPAVEAVAGRDGAFTIESTQVGFAVLEFTAVDHAQLQVPIVLDGAPLQLDVVLGTYAPGDPQAAVEAMVWTGDPAQTEPTQVPLAREPSGAMSVEIPATAPVRVQLTNVADGRTINPPGAARYEFDGGGDYMAILEPVDGKVRVALADDDRPDGAAPRMRFARPDSVAAAIAALGAYWPLRPDTTPDDAAALWQHARSGADPMVRRVATAMALAVDRRAPAELDADERALAIAALEATGFGDSLWAMVPNGLAAAVDASGTAEDRALLERVLAEQLSPERGGMLLLERLAVASERGDEAAARAIWTQLGRPPYDELGMHEFAAAWNPDRKLRVGAKLPSFEAPGMTTAAPLRSADLAGKVVLIELWATWCAPCVAAMDDLHALHTEFGGDPGPGRPRFEVLSISMDDDVAEVETFRKRWPMPWMHAFAGDRREQLYATFETGTLPFAVLVDERGDILAASTSLAPEDLRALLTEHLRTR